MAKPKVWEEKVSFKTYLTGSQDKAPIFLEHRVYQGSSGAVYPYGVTDTLKDKCEIKEYKALYLENDFIKVMILPELGGRVHRAFDKVNNRDFVYFNHVVKPALVGLLGPWISGGIEFNWPQHHRPTTFMNVDYSIKENDDNSVTVFVGETEPMHGLTITTAFTVFEDKALLQIKSKVYNGNDTPRTFLWWSNPAVKGGDGHQSVFPPDVTAVFDHGKRAVIDFPIAHGTYYKVAYDGVDISRYKNIPVPTSYMAWRSNYDFVGAYCHDEEGGLLHVADHHVSPGKKQWSWGHGDFGQAWDRNLTDEDGPYIELMTGVFTDNQPDFTWLDAGEEKEFVQNFMPYSKLGTVQNASTEAVLKLEREENSDKICCGVYAVRALNNCKVYVFDSDNNILNEQNISIAVGHAKLWDISSNTKSRLKIVLTDNDGHEILSYLEHIKEPIPLPEIAKAPAMAKDITSCDEAFFIGQHLEQYHHATRSPVDYYKRALEIDPKDYRNNVALGQYEYNRANYDKALEHAITGLSRELMLNRNPVDGQGSMLKANVLLKQGKLDEAFDEYYRATWSGNSKTLGYVGLSKIATIKKDYVKAYEYANRALETHTSNQEALELKCFALLNQDKKDEALTLINEILKTYPLNATIWYLKDLLVNSQESHSQLDFALNNREINFINIAAFLMEIKRDDLALDFFKKHPSVGAIATLINAYLDKENQETLCQKALNEFNKFVRFPNLVFERDILGKLDNVFAKYLCACFDYSHRLYERAVSIWEECIKIDPKHVGALRGLGIYTFNKLHDNKKALEYFSRALEASNNDERILFEHDLLLKLSKSSLQDRLNILDKCNTKDCLRDDLKAEYVSLLNTSGRIEDAHQMLTQRIFHVWEGGEGRVTNQFVVNAILRAHALYQKAQYKEARDILKDALTFPENLNEGRLIGQTDNDLYLWMAICSLKLNEKDVAKQYLDKAMQGNTVVEEQHYYNDQPCDYVFYNALAKLVSGNDKSANEIFSNMENWAQNAINAKVYEDFFAVSLPDLVVLDRDLDSERKENCYLMGMLGALGQNKISEFKDNLQKLQKTNPSSFKAALYGSLLEDLVDIVLKARL